MKPELTPWFDGSVAPVRNGQYELRTSPLQSMPPNSQTVFNSHLWIFSVMAQGGDEIFINQVIFPPHAANGAALLTILRRANDRTTR